MPTGRIQKPKYWFYRLVRAVLFRLYRILFRFEFYGDSLVPDDGHGVILAPNHASFLDPPILGISQKRHVTFLAKEYLFRGWLLGTILRWIGCLPVKSDKGDDFKSIRDLLRILKSGQMTVVFPEGTRSEDGKLKTPESGVGFLAMKSRAWIVPVYLRGTFQAFPKGAKFFKRGYVSVYYGEAFMPSEDEEIKKSPDPYMAVSRRIMTEIAGIQNRVEENFKSGSLRKSA